MKKQELSSAMRIRPQLVEVGETRSVLRRQCFFGSSPIKNGRDPKILGSKINEMSFYGICATSHIPS